MNLRDKLKAKAATLIERLKALGELEIERALTEAEAKEFEDGKAEVLRIKARLVELDELDASEDAITKSTNRPARDTTGNIDAVTRGNTVPAQAKGEDLTHEQKVGLCAMATAFNKHNPTVSPLDALDKSGFQEIAKQCEATRKHMLRTKAFETIGSTDGANTIYTPMSLDFIDFLRNETIVMRGQPLMIDLSAGSLDIPAGNTPTSGAYLGEGADLAYTQATTREVNLSAKHVGALTAVSNYNLTVSPLPIATIIGNDLLAGVALAMDSAALRGNGAGANPTGLLSLTNAANRFAALGALAPTVAQIDTGKRTAQLRLAQANIPVRRRRWLMSNRVFMFLKDQRDGNGNKIYPSLEAATPTWDGIPVLISEQVPSTLGGTTDESEIYLVDFGHFLVGIARALVLNSSTEASYNDGVGTRSAFQRDQTVIRAIASHDFDIRYDRAAAVITGVRWGA